MAQAPDKINDFFIDILDFFFRNMFGFLSAMTAFAYQIYQMSGRAKRLTKMQCITSVVMWIVSSFAIVVGLADSNMNRMLYGLLCWLVPLIVKPVADAVSEKATPIAEKVLNALGNVAESIVKKKGDV
jgi:hypothetical protein